MRTSDGVGSTGRIHRDPHSEMPSIAACINACGNLVAVALRQGVERDRATYTLKPRPPRPPLRLMPARVA
jgi:hypothetical protein